jgi:ferric-dicitrate binding protein FerR (iron transport regulator)
MSDLQRLGAYVALLQDRDLAWCAASDQPRASFLSALSRRRRPVRPLVVGIAVVLSIAVAAALVLTGRHPVAVASGRVSEGGGIHLEAPPSEDVPLRFSDGSNLWIRGGTAITVSALTGAGADVELEHGRARVQVAHHEGPPWTLHAGPYRVDAVGTRFDLSWDPKDARLGLHLLEGRVMVRGAGLGPSLKVEAGQTLTTKGGTWKLGPDLDPMNAGAPAPQSPSQRLGG